MAEWPILLNKGGVGDTPNDADMWSKQRAAAAQEEQPAAFGSNYLSF